MFEIRNFDIKLNGIWYISNQNVESLPVFFSLCCCVLSHPGGVDKWACHTEYRAETYSLTGCREELWKPYELTRWSTRQLYWVYAKPVSIVIDDLNMKTCHKCRRTYLIPMKNFHRSDFWKNLCLCSLETVCKEKQYLRRYLIMQKMLSKDLPVVGMIGRVSLISD